MPLFEIEGSEQLVPFRQLTGGAGLYESEIEQLLWENFEDLTGETLFPVARQPNISGGGRPDIVALDHAARVVVVEVKRDVDRGQLAQCLEYAGWARTTNLDELAGFYHRGPSEFFADWQNFTDSAAPVRVRRAPRLVLVARDFHGRTGSAFEFLIENGLPVKLIRVSLYEDEGGRKFVDVEGEHEPEFPALGPEEGGTEVIDATKIEGRRVRLSDLVEAGVLRPGQPLIWERPRLGQTYRAAVTDGAAIRLEDGREFTSPSRAAMEAGDVPAYDGWYAWRVVGNGRESLHELRVRCVQMLEANPAAGADGAPRAADGDALNGPAPSPSGSGLDANREADVSATPDLR
jgi:hypothetical protein